VTHPNDGDLRITLQRIARRIRANRAEGDLGDTQLSVLFHLERGPSTLTELAAHERITPPSMNRALNGLEDSGYVTRTKSADDARKVVIDLTPAAIALLGETRRLRTAWFSQRLATLDPGERAALEAALPTLRKLAEQ
jgi:DNA-binding MarR family transcriptional regulator